MDIYEQYHKTGKAATGKATWQGDKLFSHYGKPASILDFGCGQGYAISRFREAGIQDVWGYEYSDTAYNRFLKDDPKCTNTLTDLYFLQNKIEVVYSTEVFEHISEDQLPAVMEALQLLNLKYLFLTISLRPSSDDNAYHPTLHSRDWWEYVFNKYGFEADQQTVVKLQKISNRTTKQILANYKVLGDNCKDFCLNPPYELHGEEQPWFFCFKNKGR